jgi:tetratricopeptide (TPR) repeat protein/DNA-binding Xre family transcriptional regulator
MGRSLQVKPEFVKKIKEAVRRNGYPSQTALASGLGLSRDVVNRFLNGKPVDYLNAEEICRALNLDLGEITGYGQEINDESVLIGTQTALVNIVDPNFVGRETAVTMLDELSQEAKLILIQGPGGVGKTALAQKYLAEKFGDRVLEFFIAKETEDISPIEGILQQSLLSLNEEPGRDFGVSLMLLKRKLQREAMGVLIDNLEPALDGSGRLIEAHRRYVELLRMLADPTVKSITLITSREVLEESLDISLYRLPNLTLEAWEEYFRNRGINHNSSVIRDLCSDYQGNALAMKLLCNRISIEYNKNVESFFKERKKLVTSPKEEDNLTLLTIENLIKEQFERLKKSSPHAYNLLCRMACYSYQNVATVPIEGLFCLLWDVDGESQKGRIINALRDRSLVEVKSRLTQTEYQLHPLIRKEAINRLKDDDNNWRKANMQAAEFWSDYVKQVENEDDAAKALQAYYHYCNINEYEKASLVLTQERDNIGEKKEYLGRSFYRLGLFNEMITAIERINEKLPPIEDNFVKEGEKLEHQRTPYVRARLHDSLGDFYWLTGKIYQAIEKYNEAENIGKKNNVHQFTITPLFNRGLCKLELGELLEAKGLWEKIIDIEDKIISDNNAGKIQWWRIKTAYFCLAFVYAEIGQKLKAEEYINKFSLLTDTSKGYWTSWDRGYSHLFLALTYKNLEKIDKAVKEYDKAKEFAKKSHYTQVEAKALTGLGELHRIQKEYKIAIDHHLQSIKILEKIVAKCDLAEAYFQLALTYQAMGDQPNSQTYFDKALELWGPEKIDAPKQIERVKKAMQTTFA